MKVAYLPHFPDNPYQSLLERQCLALDIDMCGVKGVWFIRRLMLAKPDIVHFHWLHPYYIGKTNSRSIVAFILFLCQWPILWLSGAKIVWTVHNLRDHEHRMPLAEKVVTWLVSNAAKRIIVHCKTAREKLLEQYPWIVSDKVEIVPHGSYVGVYPEGQSRESARKALNLSFSAKVVLFLGEVRAYKGVTELVDQFVAQQVLRDVILVVAGRVHDPEFKRELEIRCKGQNAIMLHLGYVPDDKIQLYMAAADAVITPFRDVLTSGSLILALSFGKVIIAPRVGCVKDLEGEVAGYYYDPEEPNGVMKALRDFALDLGNLEVMGRRNRTIAEQQSWPAVAQMTKAVYEHVAKRK